MSWIIKVIKVKKKAENAPSEDVALGKLSKNDQIKFDDMDAKDCL